DCARVSVFELVSARVVILLCTIVPCVRRCARRAERLNDVPCWTCAKLAGRPTCGVKDRPTCGEKLRTVCCVTVRGVNACMAGCPAPNVRAPPPKDRAAPPLKCGAPPP